MVKISVSILSKNDSETIFKLNKTDADYIHIDVMDGQFVKENAFPIKQIEKVAELTNKKLDVHLMVIDPNAYLEQLSFSNMEYLTVHYEVLDGHFDILKKIKKKGIKCGISVKPNTDIRDIFCLLDDIDLVLIMSVEPGYGGQDFIPTSLTKVELLKQEIKHRDLKTIISIDGGTNNTNAKSCVQAGCDMLVSGSYIINSDDYQSAIDSLR